MQRSRGAAARLLEETDAVNRTACTAAAARDLGAGAVGGSG